MTAEEIRSRFDDEFIRSSPDQVTALMVMEIAAQLAELNARHSGMDPSMPKACQEKHCSYYEGYLAYGPPELTHEGFHAAERQGEAHMKSCVQMNRTGRCTVCEGYEKRLRA